MQVTTRALITLLPLLTTAGMASAECDPSGSDLANARAAVASACDCAAAADHRAYVRCAADVADAVLADKSCVRVVKRCASKSTCGRPGFVTCCRTRRSGRTSCRIKPSADRCVAPKGGRACVGAVPSCCDACDAGGCRATTTVTSSTSTTTTSTSTTTTLFPPPCGPDGAGMCGGTCPSLFDDCVQDPVTGECGCVLGPCKAIGGIGSCGGTCPGSAICTLFPVAGGCACIIPCAGSGAPPCPAPCLPGQACVFNPSTAACQCAP